MLDSEAYELRIKSLLRKGMSRRRAEVIADEEFKNKGAKDGSRADTKQSV